MEPTLNFSKKSEVLDSKKPVNNGDFETTGDNQEGELTKSIERQTSKVPSGFYLALAIGAMAISAGIAASSKRKDMANFVGMWAPSILMLGLYNKLVKTQGSDSHSPA